RFSRDWSSDVCSSDLSFDVQTIDDGNFVVRNDSFARPEIGHLVNNFDYDQDENTSFSDGLWGLLTHGFVASWAACGVAFTTPKEIGRASCRERVLIKA